MNEDRWTDLGWMVLILAGLVVADRCSDDMFLDQCRSRCARDVACMAACGDVAPCPTTVGAP